MSIIIKSCANVLSWSIGLLDQLLGVLNFILGSRRPKFFSKGFGSDLPLYYQRRDTLLNDIGKGKFDKLRDSDITWTFQSQDQVVTIHQGCFVSPLADLLPIESECAQFVLVQPTDKTNQSSNNNNIPQPPTNNVADNVFVLMLPATGEMGKGPRLALARTLAETYGWSSLILTAAYYGRRKPSGQTMFFIESVRDILVQAQAIIQEAAMLVSYFQNEYGKTNKNDNMCHNKVCLTGFSFGGAMASCAAAMAIRTGADGSRLAVASYIGSPSPVVMADGILKSSLDFSALQKSPTEPLPVTQQRVYDELNRTQLTTLTGAPTTAGQHQENPVAVVKAMSMQHDAFILPRYAQSLHDQLTMIATSARPPSFQWLWGGHVWGAIWRSVYHKQLVVEAVWELQKVQ